MRYLPGVLVFFLLCAPPVRSETFLAPKLSEWGLAFKGLADFKLKENAQSARGGISELEGTAEGKLIRITRITGLESAAAKRYIDDKRNEILSQYDRRFDGYFPPQAKGHACPRNMKPVLKERKNGGTEVKALLAMANERYVTGICLKEQVKYRLVLALTYCADKREMFDVRYFSLLKGFSVKEENAVLSMTCEKASGS